MQVSIYPPTPQAREGSTHFAVRGGWRGWEMLKICIKLFSGSGNFLSSTWDKTGAEAISGRKGVLGSQFRGTCPSPQVRNAGEDSFRLWWWEPVWRPLTGCQEAGYGQKLPSGLALAPETMPPSIPKVPAAGDQVVEIDEHVGVSSHSDRTLPCSVCSFLGFLLELVVYGLVFRLSHKPGLQYLASHAACPFA